MALCPCVRPSAPPEQEPVELSVLFSTGTLALTNGGPAGAIWVFLGVACGMFTVVLSMAEMASM
jgi:amino acid transporter